MRSFLGKDRNQQTQRGATAVELAITLLLFLTVIFSILELGRFFYVIATVQEVTRHAARGQVVNWIGATSQIRRQAVFGSGAEGAALPAGSSITDATIRITFYGSLDNARKRINPITPSPSSDPESNVNNCLLGDPQCIRYVRAALETASGEPIPYVPMIGLFSFLNIDLPGSTVIMPAESLGLQ